MKKRKIAGVAKLAAIIFAVEFTVGFCSCGILSLFFVDKERKVAYLSGAVAFDPQTILADLSAGVAEEDLFHPLPEPASCCSLRGPLTSNVTRQDDYFRVIVALHRFVWEEPMDGWQLYLINARADCVVVDQGFQTMGFDYFRIDMIDGTPVRYEKRITLVPELGLALWSEAIYAPGDRPLVSIDLSMLAITADDALRIAEENGGKEARETLQNNCIMSVRMAPSAHDDWWVDLEPGPFRIEISPVTGEIRP